MKSLDKKELMKSKYFFGINPLKKFLTFEMFELLKVVVLAIIGIIARYVFTHM